MRQIHIMIGDEDEAYVDALVKYLVGRDHRFAVHAYTDTGLFAEDMTDLREGMYDLAILSGAFLKQAAGTGQLEELNKRIPHMMQLAAADGEEMYLAETLPKYASMQTLMDRINRLRYGTTLRLHEEPMSAYTGQLYAQTGCRPAEGQLRMIAVYSPMRHDLLLPFTLVMCRDLAKRGPVVLVDCEENSRLCELLDHTWDGTLTDYLYLRQSGSGSLADFLIYEDDLAILPPVDSPMELGRITEAEWKILLDDLGAMDAQVVLLYDSFHQGAQMMLEHSERLLVIGRQESYYQRLMKRTIDALRRQFLHMDIRSVNLPLSVGERAGASWRMADVMSSNLVPYVMGQRTLWEAV